MHLVRLSHFPTKIPSHRRISALHAYTNLLTIAIVSGFPKEDLLKLRKAACHYLPDPVVGKIPTRTFIHASEDFGVKSSLDYSKLNIIAPIQSDFDIYFEQLHRIRSILDETGNLPKNFEIDHKTLHIMWTSAMRTGRLLMAQHTLSPPHGTVLAATESISNNPSLWVPQAKRDIEGDFHSRRWGRLYLSYDPYQACQWVSPRPDGRLVCFKDQNESCDTSSILGFDDTVIKHGYSFGWGDEFIGTKWASSYSDGLIQMEKMYNAWSAYIKICRNNELTTETVHPIIEGPLAQWNSRPNPIPSGHQIALVSNMPWSSDGEGSGHENSITSKLLRDLRNMECIPAKLPPESTMWYDFGVYPPQ